MLENYRLILAQSNRPKAEGVGNRGRKKKEERKRKNEDRRAQGARPSCRGS
jgi:hypothetical protein